MTKTQRNEGAHLRSVTPRLRVRTLGGPSSCLSVCPARKKYGRQDMQATRTVGAANLKKTTVRP